MVSKGDCSVIALVLDRKGVPKTSEARVDVARKIIQTTRATGIPDERLYVDPLTLTLASTSNGGKTTLETITSIRSEFPNVNLCLGLSNVSFGLPSRSYVNRVFLTLALFSVLMPQFSIRSIES